MNIEFQTIGELFAVQEVAERQGKGQDYFLRHLLA